MDAAMVEHGESTVVKVEETAVPEQHADSGMANVSSEAGGEGVPGDGNVVVEGQAFQFDETTLKTLQQFMESQSFQANIDSATGKPGGLAAEIAQHYLPTRLETKPETEEERKARVERVRLENRERKKKWREQNADRNKDNDLRCRVNKRANLIYGTHPSPQKTAYIENEFRKRRQKRKGKQSSPETEHAGGEGDMFSNLLNNPEFTNVLMGLLAQKGVEVGDKETTNQLVELLKSNPEFLRSFLSGTGAQEQQEAQTGLEEIGAVNTALVEDEMSLHHLGGDVQQAGVIDPLLHELEGRHTGLPTAQAHFDLTMENHAAFVPEQVAIQPSLSDPVTTTAPIPPPRSSTAIESAPLPSPPVVASTVQSYPTIPIPPPFMSSAIIHPPPPPERIQAFGFPPRMGQSQR